MAFPVNILDNCSHEELESLSEDYLSDLRCGDPGNPEYFSLRNQSEIPISLSTVGFVPLYGGDQTHKVLALFAPEDTLTAVALYLADQWWAVDDIVRTSTPSREGLQQVRSLGERVVLYVLNRIIYRKQEMERNEVPFLCHSSTDYAKILWRKGEAIGFYSVKPSGSTCSSYVTQSYQLPVLDTMFVRKRYRGKEFNVQMLEDFVDSFTEETLGLRYPLSSLMYTACKQYLEKYPGDQELLWEVEGVGHWFQRTLIASIFQKEARRSSEAAKSDTTLVHSDACALQPRAEPEAGNEQCLEILTQSTGPFLTVEPETEKNVKYTSASTSEASDVTPVSTRTRSSNLKRPKIGKLQEPEQAEEDNSISQNPFSRFEPKEQIVQNFNELIIQLAEENEETLNTKISEETSAKQVEQLSEENQDIHRIPEDDLEDKQVAELEPVNGDMTKEVFQPPMMDAEKIARETLDTESNLEAGDADEKSLTTLVSVNMEKSFEDSFPDQVSIPEDLEIPTHENMTAEVEETVIEQDNVSEKRAAEEDTETCIPMSCEDVSDNGLPSYVEASPVEECVLSDDAATLDTCSLEKPDTNVQPDALQETAVIRQGPLLVVELQDLALQQQTEGQKSQSAEQSEESAGETDQSAQKSVERGGESSSEDVETKVPVIERRALRRKSRAYKGPAKKRSKLSP
ncbi:soluble lamin-associated protein of 75 kDa [Ascaphus truei]|uniref:soluble lamin-associated protein of 75 kDa n=1 Tax=Ascaphus truei TaxID=8439 RepID=UPI003F59A0D6